MLHRTAPASVGTLRVGTMKVLVTMFYTGARFQRHHKYMCCNALCVVQRGTNIRRYPLGSLLLGPVLGGSVLPGSVFGSACGIAGSNALNRIRPAKKPPICACQAIASPSWPPIDTVPRPNS